jgi:hypothetical protein
MIAALSAASFAEVRRLRESGLPDFTQVRRV